MMSKKKVAGKDYDSGKGAFGGIWGIRKKIEIKENRWIVREITNHRFGKTRV